MFAALQREVKRLRDDEIKLRNQIAQLALLDGKTDDALRESEEILKQSPDDRDALNTQGNLARSKKDPDAASKYRRILELSFGNTVEDRSWRTRSRNNLAIVEMEDGRLDDAERLFQEALTECDGIGDQVLQSVLRCNLGYLSFKRGKFDESLKISREVLKLERSRGRQTGIAFVTDNIGHALLGKAKTPEVGSSRAAIAEDAYQAFAEARDIFKRIHNKWQFASAEDHLGDAAKVCGRDADAQSHWAKASAIFRDIGSSADAEKVQAKINAPRATVTLTPESSTS
jgi:tetratricopeptide (TPR) repeat protein